MPANDIMCGIVKTLQSCRRELQYEVESELKIALRKSNVFLEMEVSNFSEIVQMLYGKRLGRKPF